jgi:CRISPR-associated protein Cmr3
MQLFLEANDTFFFRDGRPFTRGEQSEGYSIFPPFPSTVMGALRSAWIAHNGGLGEFSAGKMKRAIGTKESLNGASIQIKGVFLGRRGTDLYFPIPRDLVVEKKSKDPTRLYSLSLTADSGSSSNAKLPLSLTFVAPDAPDITVDQSSGLVTSETLRSYLLGEDGDLQSEAFDFLIDEPKVGITRNLKTLTTVDGMLYRIDMKRFKNSEYGLIVDVEGIDEFSDGKLIKLGGEGKSFVVQNSELTSDPLSVAERAKIKRAIEESGLFKLYLATPAIFDQGWLPSWIRSNDSLNGDILTRNASRISMKLMTAAVGNYITIGGWDVANTRPKAAYRAVPAGSVYYFELRNGTKAEDVFDHFHSQNISDRAQSKQEGFGLAYVGTVKHAALLVSH